MIREDIGTKALKKALDRLGQAKIESGQMPMIVENKLAGRALQPLISALNGSAIQQKQSFLIGMKGEKLAPTYWVLDDFFIYPEGFKLFDDEGIASKKREKIDKGYANRPYRYLLW